MGLPGVITSSHRLHGVSSSSNQPLPQLERIYYPSNPSTPRPTTPKHPNNPDQLSTEKTHSGKPAWTGAHDQMTTSPLGKLHKPGGRVEKSRQDFRHSLHTKSLITGQSSVLASVVPRVTAVLCTYWLIGTQDSTRYSSYILDNPKRKSKSKIKTINKN